MTNLEILRRAFAETAKGNVKEATGKVVGNQKLETEGQINQATGKAQATYGDLKEDVKDAVKGRNDPTLGTPRADRQSHGAARHRRPRP